MHRERTGSTDGGSPVATGGLGLQDSGGPRVRPLWRELEDELRRLQGEHGHGHPAALDVEERLAAALSEVGRLDQARQAYEEVLTYRAVLDGDHAEHTAAVARDLFALVCRMDDRPAMAEVYYRFLSWIPMRDPASLTPALREVLGDVERLLSRST